jgi:hypothetical protein
MALVIETIDAATNASCTLKEPRPIGDTGSVFYPLEAPDGNPVFIRSKPFAITTGVSAVDYEEGVTTYSLGLEKKGTNQTGLFLMIEETCKKNTLPLPPDLLWVKLATLGACDTPVVCGDVAPGKCPNQTMKVGTVVKLLLEVKGVYETPGADRKLCVVAAATRVVSSVDSQKTRLHALGVSV